MRTITSGPVWGGLALRPLDVIPAGADALTEFTANIATDPDSDMQFVVGHQPRFGGGVVITLCNNMAAVEKPAALQKILALPENLSNHKTTTLQEILTYSSLPPNYQ